MISTAAVIAHYDVDNRLDPSFLRLLSCLKKYCNKIILVTTCNLKPSDIPDDPQILTIIRPNIGYDFFSYKVGISTIYNLENCERLFLVNSSFLILNQHRFNNAINEMIKTLNDYPIVGITESFQWEHHLQSYLILIDKEVLYSNWFKRWVLNIKPHNNKLETILAGEFGFSQLIHQNELKFYAIFQSSFREKIQSIFLWEKWYLSKNGILNFLKNHPQVHIFNYNPTHFSALPLALRYGIIKTELIRDNPHQLDIRWINQIGLENENNENFIIRSRNYYEKTGNGLTVLRNHDNYLSSFRTITTGPIARPGVHVAVILHIYYPELIDELLSFLRTILEPFDLFVTTPHEGEICKIIESFSPFAQTISVSLCENRGRDIGPFIAIHRLKFLEPYDAILKIHTKRSTYSEYGEYWRQSIFKELCGNFRDVKRALTLLREGYVGIIGPHESYLTHQQFWGADKEKALFLLESTGILNGADDIPLGFFAGSMFWFNPKAFSTLHDIPEKFLTFEPEMGQQDGTLAHAFERIFCHIARHNGYICTSLLLRGEEIHNGNTDKNCVPVLNN